MNGGMKMDKIIVGGTVIDPSQGVNGRYDILIKNGKIVSMEQNLPLENREVIDGTGKTVLPGFIDLHTHLREPGGGAKETVLTGSRAAAAGGYTGITALPNTTPVMDNARIVSEVLALAERAGLVHVWPVGAATKESAGGELAELAQMGHAGALAFTDDGRGIRDALLVRDVMVHCQEINRPFFEHCEDETLAGIGQVHDGAIAKRLGLPGIPASSETVMLARDLILAKETGCRLHVMHVSCKEAVDMIRRAKADGVPVTAEVTPHHLLLTEEALDGYNTNAKMKPPLRTQEDVDALRQGLADGTIDAVGTDHAPHTEEEKAREFSSAPFGIVGLETVFSLLYTHLVRPGILTLAQLTERMSVQPAAILGVPHGTLRVGAAADLVLVDTKMEQVIDRTRFYSKGKNTPFHGWSVVGVPVLTMVAGRVIMRDGSVNEG
jgi:dihydroorotase